MDCKNKTISNGCLDWFYIHAKYIFDDPASVILWWLENDTWLLPSSWKKEANLFGSIRTLSVRLCGLLLRQQSKQICSDLTLGIDYHDLDDCEPSWTCVKHLTSVSRPSHTFKSPQLLLALHTLSPFSMDELFITSPFSKEELNYISEITNFHFLYLQYHHFSQYPELKDISKGRESLNQWIVIFTFTFSSLFTIVNQYNSAICLSLNSLLTLE